MSSDPPEMLAHHAALESFSKIKPGDVDKIFQACCPQCDGRVWEFMQQDGTFSKDEIAEPDARVCVKCRYVHWLRGPNTSEVVPLRTPAGVSRKDRVRTLVLSMGKSERGWAVVLQHDPQMIVDFCARIDDAIEAIK